MNFIGRYFAGMKIFISGWGLFWKHKSIRKLAYIPLAITFVVLMLGITYGWGVVTWGMALVTPYIGASVDGFLLFLISAIFHLIYIVLLVVVLFLTANLFSIPFNALIAERVMAILGADYYKPKGAGDWSKYTTQMLVTGILKALLVLCLGAMVFVLSFLPFLGFIGTFFTIFVLAYDSCDYGLELKNRKLKDRWKFVNKYFWELCGYTTLVSITFMIPGMNFFMLPIFITAGTQFVAEVEKR